MNCRKGFTTIELMTSLAILAVIGGIAVPMASDSMENVHATTARAALQTSLLATNSQATIWGVRTVLCPSRDGQVCDAGFDWTGGWIGFRDDDDDRQRTADEGLVAKHGAVGGKVHLHSTVGRTRLVFQPFGSNAGSNVTFTLCDGRGASHAVALVLSNDGRLRNGVPTAASVATTCSG